MLATSTKQTIDSLTISELEAQFNLNAYSRFADDGYAYLTARLAELKRMESSKNIEKEQNLIEEANQIAKEANVIALESKSIAKSSYRIAICALIVSLMAIVIQLLKSS